MIGKIKFLIVVASLTFVVLSLFTLYNNFEFYRQSNKAEAVITGIGEPSDCAVPGICAWGRKVFVQFRDADGNIISYNEDLSTITALSGMFGVGDGVKVLYKSLSYNYNPDYNPLTRNIGVKPYVVKIYSWHYWGYPIMWFLFGLLIYFVGFKLLKQKNQS